MPSVAFYVMLISTRRSFKGEVSSFSIPKGIKVSNKCERTKKPAPPKLSMFGHSDLSKICGKKGPNDDDVTGAKKPFYHTNPYIIDKVEDSL